MNQVRQQAGFPAQALNITGNCEVERCTAFQYRLPRNRITIGDFASFTKLGVPETDKQWRSALPQLMLTGTAIKLEPFTSRAQLLDMPCMSSLFSTLLSIELCQPTQHQQMPRPFGSRRRRMIRKVPPVSWPTWSTTSGLARVHHQGQHLPLSRSPALEQDRCTCCKPKGDECLWVKPCCCHLPPPPWSSSQASFDERLQGPNQASSRLHSGHTH